MVHHVIKVLWNTYGKSYDGLSVYLKTIYNIWPFMKFKRQIKAIGGSVGYIS